MSRRIETGTAVEKLGVNAEPADYLGRLVGYIPAEIVGVYLTAAGFAEAAGTDRQKWLWIIFGVSLVLTPFYMIFATYDKKKGPLYVQVILATLAFPLWVFAIGGPFRTLSWYKAPVASILLVLGTAIIGIKKPKKGS
jgi:hypothetical protein